MAPFGGFIMSTHKEDAPSQQKVRNGQEEDLCGDPVEAMLPLCRHSL
jgi:hypothetical protein